MKYVFIKAHRDEFSLQMMCDVFKVSRSGYYDWLNHKPSKRALANKQLDEKIVMLFNEHKHRYGSPRITKALRAQNESASHTRVARRMKQMGLKAIAKKKFKVTTDSEHRLPVYKNRLNRDFTTTGINQKWAQDITYIHTKAGWLYLAVVIDLHSRAIIGWSMKERMTKDLVCDALLMALFHRKFPKEVIIHSDRGSQYCAKAYQRLIKQYQLIGSMSRRGNCWDNAISESFFHTLKVELIHEENYMSREEARQSIFEYIEVYYNQKRYHSSLDYKTPCEFEYAC